MGADPAPSATSGSTATRGTDLSLGEVDILIAEGLHGRLDPEPGRPSATPSDEVRPLADAVVDRAAGRAFWELPDDEFSLLTEPGTVGALLREVREQPHAKYVAAALHHRHPDLVPLTNGTTWRQLIAHVGEGDSGVEAVIHRELTANRDAFDALEQAVNAPSTAPGSPGSACTTSCCGSAAASGSPTPSSSVRTPTSGSRSA